MKTKEQLTDEIKEDIEAFGETKIVYAYFGEVPGEGIKLIDYSLEPNGKCIDQEELINLLNILEE